MMTEFVKHRLEKEVFGHDFGPELAVDETLTGTPTVAVLRWNGTTQEWEDVTSQFGTVVEINPEIVDGSISGKPSAEVDFMLTQATGTAQNAEQYVVRIEVDTSAGRHLAGQLKDRYTGLHRLPALAILEEGDPNAP